MPQDVKGFKGLRLINKRNNIQRYKAICMA